MESIDISIKWPFKWCLVGSSGSGKTNFSLQIIRHAPRLFDQLPSKIIFVYKEFQNIYNKFNEYIPTNIYHEDEIDFEEVTKQNSENLLIICDDLYYSKKIGEVAEHFLIKGRHRNTSWLILTQSIFNHPSLKNISRNSTHITLFKSVRLNEPHIFFSQLRPSSSKVLQDIYSKASANSYSYLDIDLSQTCPDKYRYKSDIFNNIVVVYIIMNSDSFKTMYLIGKNEMERIGKNEMDRNVNKSEKDGNGNDTFKLSLQNKDLCEDGVNLSVKPIKIKMRKSKPSKDNDDKSRNSSEMIPNSEIVESNKKEESSNANSHQASPLNIPHQMDSQDKNGNEKKRVSSISSVNSNSSDMDDEMLRYSLKRLQGKIEDTNCTGKRKALHNESNQELKRGKQFHHYPFLEENEEKRLVPEIEKKSQRNEMQDDDRENQIESGFEDKELRNTNEIRTLNKVNKESIEGVNNISKRQKRENDLTLKKNEQWIRGLKSAPRIQFKRKKDTIGFRKNPIDVEKSLISPSDFKFLNKDDSGEILDKWKPLSELSKKRFKSKRFKPYRSFSVFK